MEDKILVAAIEDKALRCLNRNIMTSTAFLDMRQRTVVENHLRGRGFRMVFDGGYDDAERTVLIFLPDYIEEYDAEEDSPLAVIRASIDKKAKPLTHRDYLGALMGLGIKRECIGDILVRDDGADIAVLEEIKDFLLLNLVQAGKTSLSVSEAAVSDIKLPEQKVKTRTDTVASLRLDNVLPTAFGGSRTTAVSAIKAGLVFVNNLQVMKSDFRLKEGDKITLRGKGKAVLSEVGGETRKNRIYITVTVYI